MSISHDNVKNQDSISLQTNVENAYLGMIKSIITRNNIFYFVLDANKRIISTNYFDHNRIQTLSDVKSVFSYESIDKINTILSMQFHDAFEMTIKENKIEHCIYNKIEFPGYTFIESHILSYPNEQFITESQDASVEIQDLQMFQALLNEMQQMETNENSEETKSRVMKTYIPQLMQLKERITDPLTSLCLDIIKQSLDELVDTDGQISKLYKVLTPSEIKVADFIRKGMTSKDIATALDIAQKTVDNHRNSLREKLGIKNKGVNLQTYLMHCNPEDMLED